MLEQVLVVDCALAKPVRKIECPCSALVVAENEGGCFNSVLPQHEHGA